MIENTLKKKHLVIPMKSYEILVREQTRIRERTGMYETRSNIVARLVASLEADGCAK
jgi:transcriptional regulator of met regulon